MYGKSSQYYDLAFPNKNYSGEADFLKRLIIKHNSSARKLLNLACGTGNHETYFAEDFSVCGLDLNKEFIEIAKRKNPDVDYHVGDMTEFDLGKKFDGITCLFSSIANLCDLSELKNMIRCCVKHLANSGILIIEPFFELREWVDGLRTMKTFDTEDFKYSVIAQSGLIDKKGVSKEVHTYLDEKGFDVFEEHFTFSLFKTEEIKSAFEKNGLKHEYLKNDMFPRGLHLGYLD